MKTRDDTALVLVLVLCVSGCSTGLSIKAASGKYDSLVDYRSPGQVYKSTESERVVVIRRTGARSVHFTILNGAPSSKVFDGVATLINEGLDPDTGLDIDDTAYPLDTYVYSEPRCYFEIGVGQSPQFDSNLEISSCACEGFGDQCPLEKDVLYIRQDGAGGL